MDAAVQGECVIVGGGPEDATGCEVEVSLLGVGADHQDDVGGRIMGERVGARVGRTRLKGSARPAGGTRRLAEDGDVAGVAPNGRDRVADPGQREHVEQPAVRRRAVEREEAGMLRR